MSEITIIPVVLELVVVFQDNHMIVLVDSPKVEFHGKLLSDSIMKAWTEKLPVLVIIEGLNGKAFVLANLVQGFYFRPAHQDTTKQFQERWLKLQERAIEAVEKCADGHVPGDEWKKGDGQSD